MAEHQVHGVVGTYIEPDEATKKAAMQRFMTGFITILWCVLGAGVSSILCSQILLHFGWTNWTGIQKREWQPDWNTLPASLAGSMVTSYFIRRHKTTLKQ